MFTTFQLQKMINQVISCKILCRRRRYLTLLTVMCSSLLVLCYFTTLVEQTSEALMPAQVHQPLEHFRRSRDLRFYFDNIEILIEPSSMVCDGMENIPLVVLVTSVPSHFEHRDVIRNTWGKHFPTYFILGIDSDEIDDEMLVENYVEAKQYRDLVVFSLREHYQNLTLKSALLLRWAAQRCIGAGPLLRVMKTDDDVLLQPTALARVLADHADAPLVGYRLSNRTVHRDETSKWYMPRWLCSTDQIPHYLSGTGYIIAGNYLSKILEAAYTVPLVNLEDIYFTYLVANQTLQLPLTDDRRLSPYKPLVPHGCAYWRLALMHSMEPAEMMRAWDKIQAITEQYNQTEDACSGFHKYLSHDALLY